VSRCKVNDGVDVNVAVAVDVKVVVKVIVEDKVNPGDYPSSGAACCKIFEAIAACGLTLPFPATHAFWMSCSTWNIYPSGLVP